MLGGGVSAIFSWQGAEKKKQNLLFWLWALRSGCACRNAETQLSHTIFSPISHFTFRILTVDNHGVVKADSGMAPSSRGNTASDTCSNWLSQTPSLNREVEYMYNAGSLAGLVNSTKDHHRVQSCQFAHGVIHHCWSIGERLPGIRT
jgi:hypothetical protein